jgi:hypothetical protein
MKVAVITPYFNEPLAILQRCHESVKRQRDLKENSVTHFFIADGQGLDALDNLSGVRHIRLGVSHNDNGNTPRAAGGLCALSEGFDAICYLDADNLYDNMHVSSAIKLHETSRSEAIFSNRYSFFPNGDCYDFSEIDRDEDSIRKHVDTSCISLFGAARRAVALWSEMPASMGPVCDRVFFQYLISNHSCSWTGQKTVFFETWYSGHFSHSAMPQPWTAKEIPPRSEAKWLRDFQQFARRSRTPVPIQVAHGWIAPSHQRTRLLQITSTDQKLPNNLIRSFSKIRGFISDAEGVWDSYLASKLPELKTTDLQKAKSDDNAGVSVDNLLNIAALLNERLGSELIKDLAPCQRKHLADRGWLTICTTSSAIIDNLRIALKQRIELDNLVTKKIVLVGPPAFFTHSSKGKTGAAYRHNNAQENGSDDAKWIARAEVDRYCMTIASAALGCGPRQALMIPAHYCQTRPTPDLLYKVEHFMNGGPTRPLEAPAPKLMNLGEHLDYFIAHDRYSEELTAMADEIQQGFELSPNGANQKADAPPPAADQNYFWPRVHQSFWHHRDDFAPFFGIPEPTSGPEENFQVIKSIERAGQVLRERKEMAAKYGFI